MRERTRSTTSPLGQKEVLSCLGHRLGEFNNPYDPGIDATVEDVKSWGSYSSPVLDKLSSGELVSRYEYILDKSLKGVIGRRGIWPFQPVSHVVQSLNHSSTDFLTLEHETFGFSVPKPGLPSGYHYREWLPRFKIRDLNLVDYSSLTGDVLYKTKSDWESWSYNGHNLQSLRSLAAEAILPDLEDGFSLPVFLFELKDLPRMVTGFANSLQSLTPFLKRLLTKPLATLSQTHLSAVFGWLPFVRDVKTIIERMVTLREDVEKFLAAANRPLTYHFKWALSPSDVEPSSFFETSVDYRNFTPDTTYEMYKYIQSVDFKVEDTKVLTDVIYHATAYFTYQIPDLGRLTKLFAKLDRFGVNLSVSDIWEVIPFSFVVDWFFDIQSYLRGFDLSNLPVNLVIHDFCDSLIYTYTEESVWSLQDITVDYDVWIYKWPTDGWTVSPANAKSVITEEAYYRWNGPMVIPADKYPGLRMPSGMAIVNLTALAGSRLGI